MAFSIRSLLQPDKEGRPPQPVPEALSPPFSSLSPPDTSMPSPEEAPSNFLFKVIRGKEPGSVSLPAPAPSAATPTDGSPLSIGDMLSSIPAEVLTKASIDPSTPLPLARESIERALRSGQASIPLHEIYLANPSLFSQMVTPEDPRRVTLPPGKIVKLLASVGVKGSPPAPAISAPDLPSSLASPPKAWDVPASSPAPVLQETAASPFTLPSASKDKDPAADFSHQETLSPFQKVDAPAPEPASVAATSPVVGDSGKMISNPFSLAAQDKADSLELTPPSQTGASPANPFDRISALGRNSAPASQPAASTPTVASANALSLPGASEGKVRLPLPVVLQFCTEEQIGISPSLLPANVEVTLPEEAFHRQLAHGDKPCVRLTEIRLGLIPEHKVLLAAARPELKVRLPVDLFELSPSPAEAPVASPSVPVPAPAPAPASLPIPPAEKPSSSFLLAEDAEDDTDPFANMPMIPDWAPDDSDGLGSLEGSPFDLPPLPGLESLPQASPSPFASPATASSLTPAKPRPEFPLAPSAPAPVSQQPHFSSFPTSAPLPAPAPKQPRSRVTSTRPGSKHRRILLRVLLGTYEDLDAEGAIRHICRLPGVSSVVCLRKGKVFSSAGDGSEEAHAFVSQAQLIQLHLLPLSQVSGMENTEIVTLRSEQRLASFALNSELTLGILHAPSPHETELLERITLLATELAAMLGSH